MQLGEVIYKAYEELAGCFEMGKYYEICGMLDMATYEKDEEVILETAKKCSLAWKKSTASGERRFMSIWSLKR